MYIDTDAVFLAPPEKVWENFKRMSSEQIVALAAEQEDYLNNTYRLTAKHPYYGPAGML